MLDHDGTPRTSTPSLTPTLGFISVEKSICAVDKISEEMSGQTSKRSDPPTGPSRTAPDPPSGVPPFPVPPPLMDPPSSDTYNGPDAINGFSSAVNHTSNELPPIPPLMSVGAKHVASGSTASSSRLPAPPKFQSPMTSTANSTSIPVIKSRAYPSSSSSSLPPPPKISMPVNSKSESSQSDYNNSSNNLSYANPNDIRFSSSDRTTKGKNVEATIHSTTEQIPPLSSAPNSGGSLTRDVLGYDAGTGQDNATMHNTTESATSFFTAAAVPSSDNWSQWGGSLMEKAGKLASSTMGSAVDLVGVEKNSVLYYYDGVNGTGENKYSFSQESPNPPKEEGAFGTQSSFVSMATPDPATYPTFSDGEQFPSPPLINHNATADTNTAINSLAPDEDQGIEIGADGLAPSASPRRVPAPPNFELDTEAITTTDLKQKHDTQRRQRALANPSVTSLAGRQSHLTVLVVPTAEAQSIASKNNTTLTEMFRVFGNSNAHSTPNVRGLDPGTSQQQTDLILEPPLPPFRSANRSMMLHWDQIVLNFISGQEMEDMPVAEAEAEKALAEAARLWDEDRIMQGRESNINFDEDAELNELEKCVVEALAEEEEEQRIRKEDGIHSMTSLPPPRSRKQSSSDVEDAEGKDHEYASAFKNDEEDALKSCADSAFALTALPSAPWLARFRHTLDCSTDGMGHDMLCNPAAVILAASSSEPFLTCFAELANVHHLPRPYHDGRYDPNALRREFLLLHDVANGPKQFDDARALAQMRERFGPGCCSILRINSLPTKQYSTGTEDVEWENAGPPSPFTGGSLSERYKSSTRNDQNIVLRGSCLSLQDKRSIRRYIANMVATGLVPALERRIAVLNSAVTNAKKGVKNVIKSFWRKPKENLLVNVSGYGDGNSGRGDNSSITGDGTHGSVKYRYDSIESQTRLLADTLFLIRDYDAALGMYKLVKDDYKHDRAMLHYASVQEMIVLCMHMLDPYGRENRFMSEVHHSIETALYSYTRAADDEREAEGSSGSRPGEAPHATRLATRLCLVISAARALCQGKHMEIADLLASASSHETPLGAAVLLEQSSSHYHHAGMLRKYAFHMLMAGHMFRSAGQERHSFRCFSASLFVYHGERWEELKSHLRSAIAAQLYGMGRYALSMQFYAKLISMTGGGRVSVRSQQKFLNHIIDICKGHQSSALVAVDRINGAEQGVTLSDTTDVLEGFSGAARTLEISNVGFPCVKDSSITVRVENTSDSSALFGHADSINVDASLAKGDETIWQDMTNCAEAELRAAIVSSTTSNIEVPPNDGRPTPPPIPSGNEEIDRVLMEIDKEERAAEYKSRVKRKGNLGAPEVRATYEPLAVSFSLSNPLGLDIDLIDVQLVASLACKQSGMIHTNEFSMSTKDCFQSTHAAQWQFHGSEKVYSRPEFLRQQPMTLEHFDSQSSQMDDNPEPYFVVTKLNTKIKSNSEERISLNICPLVKGSFTIHGFRFKLLGEVWMYHRFDLRGPLLQDSQVNRARRARGESFVLRSKVEREMPFLQVDITPSRTDPNSPGVVLQGQTSSWTLKLTNLGYAPACNIMLKTNSPWLNIATSESDDQDENASTSHCVGPSGTLMRVPFNRAAADCNSDSSDVPDILQPGETAEVPVVIRTSGGGRQDFFMLVRYELWCNEYLSSNLTPRHRWARKLLSFPVYPSITMSASLMPSYSNKGEHILSIELMNYRSDRESNLEIDLKKIFIASRHFEVRQMSGQVDGNAASKSPIPSINCDPDTYSYKIGWQERVTLHFLVIPLEKLEKPTFTLSTLSFSIGNDDHSTSSGNIAHYNGGHVTDFMCRERAHDVFSSSLQAHKVEKERQQALQEKEGQPRHVAQIRRARTSMPIEETSNSASIVKLTPGSGALTTCPITSSAHPTSVASLCPINGSSNINIICCWSARVGNDAIDKAIIGQHHLRSLLVRPQNKSKGCPLALTAKHATKAFHNFVDSPLDVDLEVSLRNRLVQNSVDFEFALDHQSGFDFIGATCFKWTLAGGEEITIPLKARFYCRGVYNLQSVRLTVLKTDLAVPYLFPLQWTIEVEDKI